MGDCNDLSKFSQMPMCYFGVLQDILSSLRKPCPGDCYYFCSCLGVSTFQIGRQGFSSRAENSSALLPSTFQPEATTSKTAIPPAAPQVSRAVAFVPLICHQEKGRKPVVDPVLTKTTQHTLPDGTCFCTYFPTTETTYLSLKQAIFPVFFLVEEQLPPLCEFMSYHISA